MQNSLSFFTTGFAYVINNNKKNYLVNGVAESNLLVNNANLLLSGKSYKDMLVITRPVVGIEPKHLEKIWLSSHFSILQISELK